MKMQGLNSFIVSFCSGCILLGFLYMLCPSGSMSKSVKYIFCLCFLCCIVGASTAVQIPQISQFNTTDQGEILTEQNAAAVAQSVFSEALSSGDINFRKILVDTNKTDNGSIIISRVTVYTDVSADIISQAIGSDSYEVCVINE